MTSFSGKATTLATEADLEEALKFVRTGQFFAEFTYSFMGRVFSLRRLYGNSNGDIGVMFYTDYATYAMQPDKVVDFILQGAL